MPFRKSAMRELPVALPSPKFFPRALP